MAVDLASMQSADHLNRIFQLPNHEFAVSILNRTGHARFRRGPSGPQSPSTSANSKPESLRERPAINSIESKECASNSNATMSASTSSSMTLSVAGDESVYNGKKLSSSSSSSIITPAPTFSARKPPLPSSHRNRSSDRFHLEEGFAKKDHSVSRGSHGCHCCKRRKIQVKVKRIPVIGSKVTRIPADEFSWKKHGEKRIEESSYPRVYYKCNTAAGCPARKRVEMARGESKVLIVTYQGEHRHSPVPIRRLSPFPS